jgi:HEPN domain-containing protein
MIAEIQTGQLNGDPVWSLPIDALSIPENGWPLSPFQIVSLLEVLKNYGHLFYLVGGIFKQNVTLIGHLNPTARATPIDGDARESFQSVLESIETCCKDIELGTAVLKGVEWAKKEIGKEGATFDDVRAVMAELERRINDELSSVRFFHVPTNSAQYYPRKNDEYKKPLFSSQTMKKFSKSIEDAEEAGKCFALARYTACVFHLMRVMERGVQRLGKKLKVTIPVEEKDWGVISSSINGALRRLPNSTVPERKIHARYAKAAVYLDNVRESWRNPTMHPKETYTEEEAENAFRFVRQYMEYLTKVL